MTAVQNCGCDGIDESDASKYDSNRHYFTCHLFTFDCNSPHAIDTEPVKEEDRLALSTKIDDLVTKVLFKIPNMVIVFSNTQPNKYKLSSDRWIIFSIKKGELKRL